eukprot:4076786-Alexandrium_andersonii.AAC.1
MPECSVAPSSAFSPLRCGKECKGARWHARVLCYIYRCALQASGSTEHQHSARLAQAIIRI